MRKLDGCRRMDEDNLDWDPFAYPVLQGNNLLSQSASWRGLGWAVQGLVTSKAPLCLA